MNVLLWAIAGGVAGALIAVAVIWACSDEDYY